MERNEYISATYASVKDGSVAGVWKIEDLCEFVSTSNVVWSRHQRKNTALASESEIVLDFIETVACNMRGCDEGKIKTHTDCRKVQEFLTANK